MRKLFLIIAILFATIVNAQVLKNTSGNVLKSSESNGHVLIKVYENDSDTAQIIKQFSIWIGNELHLAKETIEWQEGVTLEQAEQSALNTIIIAKSLDGTIYKYEPYIDPELIEGLYEE